MKTQLRFLLVLAITGCSLVALSQTQVYGPTVSGRWTLSGSPYEIMDNIIVPYDSTLTIDAGVEIIFQGHYWFNVDGRILGMGTSSDSILFTAADPVIGWNAMLFNTSTGLSEFEYCIFEYSHCDISQGGGGAICCYMNELNISHCSFKNNSLAPDCMTPYGGAVVVFSSGEDVTISDCHFENNVCPVSGGAVLCWGCSPLIEHCTFIGNTAGYGGGAIAMYSNAHPTISDCVFLDNYSEGTSGAIGVLELCDPIIRNCLIKNNHAVETSGGIGIKDGCNPLILNCTIRGNETQYSAGGIGIDNSGGTIENCVIDSNIAAFRAGGVGIVDSTTVAMKNCQINANIASERAGGMNIVFSEPALSNNTFVNNQAALGGGIVFETGLSPILRNCILWGNTAQDGNQVYLDSIDNDPGFIYCNIDGGQEAFGGPGALNYSGIYLSNFNTDPCFKDPEIADYHLNWPSYPWLDTLRSPCIDAGDPSTLFNDPDGTRNDIGAYYFNQMPETPEAYDPPSWTPISFLADWSCCCGALGYVLDVAYDPDFSGFVPGYENLELNDTSSCYNVTGLENGHYYYYRVKTFNSACCSDYSNYVTVSYFTSVLESQKTPFTIYSLENTLYLQSTEKIYGESFVMIFNTAGQLLAKKSLRNGLNSIPVNASRQVLLIKIVLNGEAYQKKLVKMEP